MRKWRLRTLIPIIPTDNVMGEKLAVGSQITPELIKEHIDSFDYAGKSLEVQAQYSQNRAYESSTVVNRCSFALPSIPVVIVRFDNTRRTNAQAGMAMRYICHINAPAVIEEDTPYMMEP